MIPQSPHLNTLPHWQQQISQAINDAEQLLQQLGLQGALTAIDKNEIKQFPLRVPQSYVNKMQRGDVNDPLLRQVFPLIDEAYQAAGFVADPVGDYQAVRSPGLLQKYQGRVLLVSTGACAVHCRYCFRRHYPYSGNNPLAGQWSQTLHTLKQDKSVSEVILSGGDPLSLTDDKLGRISRDLATLPHLKRLRIHTRLPVVLPARICDSLINWITASPLKITMVIHSNHGNEIDAQTANALARLRDAGCQLLNQAVLLKGINDSAQTLIALSERLNEVDVLPYYLHLLDKVAGARHFDVAEQHGIELIQHIRKHLPGYLVPRLVREQQGEHSKTVIA